MGAERQAHRNVVTANPVPPVRHDRFLPIGGVVFVVSLTIRLIHLLQIRRAPLFGVFMGDAQSYHAWARQIAAGDLVGSGVFYQAPLYPYFLAVVYRTLGESPMAIRLCQAAIGSLACVLLAFAAWRLFSRPAAIAAGLMLAFYAPAVFFDGLVQKSVLDGFLVCLALALLSRIIIREAGARSWLWVGMTLGLLTLSRENALVFAATLLLWIPWGQRGAAANRLAAAACLVGGVTIVLLPVAVRNELVGGEFHLTTSQFGPNFYIGNNATASGTYEPLRFGHGDPALERQDATELAERAMGRPLTPAEVSTYWTRRALEYIRAEPRAWLALTGRKILLVWNAAEIADTEDQLSYADWSLVLRIVSRVWHFGVLAPVAVLGIWTTWPRRRELSLLYLLPATYVLALVAFAVMARYRYPLVPFLILFASAGVANAPRLLSAAPQRLVAGLTAVILAAIFCNVPIYSMTGMRSITDANVATELQAQGKLDDAIALYRTALARDPNDALTYSNLGTALKAKGQLDEAIAQYRRALALAPGDADNHYNLANALMAQEKLPEAIEQFREALRINPRLTAAHLNLGNALADLGQTEQAVNHYREALDLEPDSAEALNNLGLLLSTSGRIDEAIAMLRRLVELTPESADAHNELGIALAQQNQMDDAIGHFRRAIALAPALAEPHGNLAMALQIRGELDEAVQQYQEALRLAPENGEMKQRLQAALAARDRTRAPQRGPR